MTEIWMRTCYLLRYITTSITLFHYVYRLISSYPSGFMLYCLAIPLMSSFYSCLALLVLSTRIFASMLGKERKEKNANEHTYDILILQYTLPIKYCISNFLKRLAYIRWSRASVQPWICINKWLNQNINIIIII